MVKWNGNRGKGPEDLPQAATNSTPKPGNYLLGSLESRAAARAMISAAEEDERVIEIQCVLVRPDGTRTEGPVIKIPPA